ncbi:hypothetical protein JOE21_002150 [Desmospora profundinema]|uniref:Uncharacterized protein n=1 Tax=Desmospora profundinema TaxID=1571184 RepID=A0ABU1IMZ8_9BACL|nr:hypothetical protein [Desmospora profundinema]
MMSIRIRGLWLFGFLPFLLLLGVELFVGQSENLLWQWVAYDNKYMWNIIDFVCPLSDRFFYTRKKVGKPHPDPLWWKQVVWC